MHELFKKVRAQRLGAPRCISANPEIDVPKTLREIADSRFYESDYKALTSQLLWEDVSYDEAASALAIITDYLDGID